MIKKHNTKKIKAFFILKYVSQMLEFVIIWVVKFTHKPVDVRWCMSPNVWDEESDELWWHVVKHRTVHVHLWENLTCDTQSAEKRQVKIHNTTLVKNRAFGFQELPSVKGRTSCGETNLWKVSSSFGN